MKRGALAALFAASIACASAFAQEDRKAEEAAAKAKLDALRAELAQIAAEQEAARGEKGEIEVAMREADVAHGEVAKRFSTVEEEISAKTAEVARLTHEEDAL